jgi:hypothetical protein
MGEENINSLRHGFFTLAAQLRKIPFVYSLPQQSQKVNHAA